MRQIKRVSIIGAGSWGTAVAKSIAESKPHLAVVMWAYERPVAASINSSHENAEFLPGTQLPASITATNDLEEAVKGTDVVILATPSKAAYDVCRKMAKHVTGEMYVGFLTKGFCKIDGQVLTISQAMERAMPRTAGRIVAISGPSHAEEVCRRFHTCLNAGSESEEARTVIAGLLTSEWVQCRTTADIRAVEVGGTLKNPAAIAAGMISALPRCGDNLAGALISEALKEMVRLGRVFGISEDGMIDISGLGDLVATALSQHSRNRRFGKDIAGQIMTKGNALNLWDRIVLRVRPYSVIERMGGKFHYLAEGAYAIEPLIELAEKEKISIPVYRALYEVLLNKKDPSLLIETIKNPERFNELFFSTKIQIAGRKRGLETIKGKAFREHIIAMTMERFVAKKNDGLLPYGTGDVIHALTDSLREQGITGAEAAIIRGMNSDNYGDSISRLAGMYIDDIADSYSTWFKWLCLIGFAFSRIGSLFMKRTNGLVVSGPLDEIRRVGRQVTILYAAPFQDRRDAMFAAMSIARSRLPFPRFQVDAGLGARERLLLKRCGGFTIDRNKLDNMVYRETLVQYLSTMAGHGVPVLSMLPVGTEATAQGERNVLVSAITECMYRHAAELALVPFGVSYLGRPGDGGAAPSFRDLLSATAWVNFSKPIRLSEYTKQPHMMVGLPGIVAGIWEKERKILPHYLLCKALAEHGFSLKQADAIVFVKKYMRRAGRRFDHNPTRTVRKGLAYLEESGVATSDGVTIEAADREMVSYYAGLVP